MVPAIVAGTVLVVVATLSIVGSTAGDVPDRVLATLRTLVRPQSQTVPASWNVFVTGGLLLAVPAEFGPARPTAQVPMFGGPGAPTLLHEVRFDRGLSILVWKGTVRTLLDEFWLRGNQQPYTRRPLNAPLIGEEVVTTTIGQSDPLGPGARKSGTDEHRNLFVQLAPDQIAHVAIGPTSAAEPGTATKISAADRALQDQIAAYIRATPDTEKSIDRAQVETIVRRVVGQLQNADVPAGSPSATKVFAGEELVYSWPNFSQSFAYIVVYPDRAARERDEQPRALAQWNATVVQRGVGNILVLVGSNDANLRYRLIAALDELAN
ncbi:MAG TPA: hypothetical protein VGR85_09355 [Candidatus Limnocylindria bacterium]|jgi:hypothetical protein|nr:hypothetical protein [Candidatus Limnocylindria bacterium]